MRPPRRPSIVRELLEFPLRLFFGVGILIIQGIVLVRRILPASLVLLLCAVLPLLGFSLRVLDGLGSWLMLAAAMMLFFAAGAVRSKR
jgi:hypothetical protein